MAETLSALLQEGRTFPPPAAFAKHALVTDASVYDDAERDWHGFWARRRSHSTGTASGTPSSSGSCRSRSGSSAASSTSPRTASTATSAPATATRSRSTGRASPATAAPSPTRSCSTRRRRVANAAARARRRQGRPRRDLHGDGAGDGRGDAGVRAHRRRALRGVRRLHRRSRSATASTTREAQGAHHRRRRVAPRVGRPAQGHRRRGARRDAVDRARRSCCGARESECAMQAGRDLWWHDAVGRQPAECAPESMDAEDLLFILYTSGTTGKPKGIMHTTGGYLTQVAYTHKYVFDLKPDTDVYWCTADVGWVTGHSYIVYGPLANRTTSRALRGHARLSRQGPALVDRREVRGHDPLHRAHRDPDVHEVGRRPSRRARPVVAAAARHGRRADQPRGVGLVLQA